MLCVVLIIVESLLIIIEGGYYVHRVCPSLESTPIKVNRRGFEPRSAHAQYTCIVPGPRSIHLSCTLLIVHIRFSYVLTASISHMASIKQALGIEEVRLHCMAYSRVIHVDTF